MYCHAVVLNNQDIVHGLGILPLHVTDQLSVHYRDGLGNVSPIYCDNIDVEGMPPPPDRRLNSPSGASTQE